ncbi:hypothetical protein [Methanobrevibacter sp. DSM 116169]|uniref:hypothetical protein n=1 Tax=Methanobrevibacter sp. DSM 116169 TaxID=3242727 RepID=UPI0038FC8A29
MMNKGIIIGVIVLIVALAGVAFFVMGDTGDSASADENTAVIKIEHDGAWRMTYSSDLVSSTNTDGSGNSEIKVNATDDKSIIAIVNSETTADGDLKVQIIGKNGEIIKQGADTDGSSSNNPSGTVELMNI